jgi:hypothetical protein
MSKNENSKKVVTQRQSVHVVFFSCSNCGEETDHIQFCPDCAKPMRVIDVVEKFGEDADGFMKRIQERIDNGTLKPDDLINLESDEEPNIIVMGEEDHIDDGAIVDDNDVESLDDIFPDESEERDTASSVSDGLTDLDDIVAELDKEEDEDFSLDLGEEGLPEL